LDAPDHTTTFSSSVQENTRHCPNCFVPPTQTSLLRRGESTNLFFPHHVFTASEQKTQRYIRVYNLAEQKLLKTLNPGSKWISSMDIHPSGTHLIVGGYDRKLCWFDLELSDKPYKILRSVSIRFLSYSVHGLNFDAHADITKRLFARCIFTRRTLFLHRHQMTGLSKFSMEECTAI
jgi:WD40 repeat protein